MRILVTGGCGFIGSNFIRHVLGGHPGDEVVNLDALTYAGNLENLADVEADYPGRYRFVRGDICDADLARRLIDDSQAVVHFAAESHVDRSIEDASTFVRTNVLGTQVLLDTAHRSWTSGGGPDQGRRFVHVSTDEVYGALALDDPSGFDEDWPLNPQSPYSASKAGGDHLARAYHHTHGLPVMVTRCSNNYGPCQFPEKLVPLMIINAINGRELPVYGDGQYVRDWLYVLDHCRATDLVLRGGRPGEVYNVGGGSEQANVTVVQEIIRLVAERTGRPAEQMRGLIKHVKDRPGHDRRYAINAGKIMSELGYRPHMDFARGMAQTVEWYLVNRAWCERVTSGAYRGYYQRMYQGR